MPLGVADDDSAASKGPVGVASAKDGGNAASDEELLLWDAQTAMLSHDLQRASEIFARAALPPHCSAKAALALFHLANSAPGPSSPVSPVSPPMTHARNRYEASVRPAKRDAQAMNEAAAWLVLSLVWAIRAYEKGAQLLVNASRGSSSDEDEGLVIPRKGKSAPSTQRSRQGSRDGPVALPVSASASDTSSYTLKTPSLSITDLAQRPHLSAKALLASLEPLLAAYRLGKIQENDPPFSTFANKGLAQHLSPHGSNVWRAGGKVVKMILSLPLDDADLKGKRPIRSASDTNPQVAVRMIACYIAGMTSITNEASSAHFERVIHLGPSGSPSADELMKHSEKRLLALPCTPSATSPFSSRSPTRGFPFSPGPRLGGHPSTTSIFSCASSFYARSRLLNTPVKSDAALAKLSKEDKLLDHPEVYKAKRNARDLLRKSAVDLARMREKTTSPPSPGWLPYLGSWLGPSKTMKLAQPEPAGAPAATAPSPVSNPPTAIKASVVTSPVTPLLAKSQSSPILLAFQHHPEPPPLRSHRSSVTLRKSLPFEPKPEDAINATDPALAAAEMASTLTKKAVCDVCHAAGVNFPNCRKCGLTFCSRPCRVDRNGAGDGKRHICGAWESRKLLSVPTISPTSRRRERSNLIAAV